MHTVILSVIDMVVPSEDGTIPILKAIRETDGYMELITVIVEKHIDF